MAGSVRIQPLLTMQMTPPISRPSDSERYVLAVNAAERLVGEAETVSRAGEHVDAEPVGDVRLR